MSTDISDLREVAGFIGACLVDADSGLMLAAENGDTKFDLEAAGAANSGFSNVIIPLSFISAAEMSEILKPVAPPKAFVRVDTKRNLLVLAGTQLQIEGWLDIIYTFDVDQLAGTSVGVFPISRGSVQEVYEEVQHVLNTGFSQRRSSSVNNLPIGRTVICGNYMQCLSANVGSVQNPSSETTS